MMQQRLDQKQKQDGQQQPQKIDLIKQELQKYREIKKSPSFSNHFSSKQFQNCSEIEKRKKIFTYINSNQIGQESINISSVNPPISSRNFKEQQYLNQNKKYSMDSQYSIYGFNQQEACQNNNNYISSTQNTKRSENDDKKIDFNTLEYLSYNDKNYINSISNTLQRNNSQEQTNQENIREITLADFQSFDNDSQCDYFSTAIFSQQETKYGQQDFKKQQLETNLNPSKMNQQSNNQVGVNPPCYRFASQPDGRNMVDMEDEDNDEQLTYDDLRIQHQGTIKFNDTNDKSINKNNDKKDRKKLSLQNLEEHRQQFSSYQTTLISSGRNDTERLQMINTFSNIQSSSTKFQQQPNFLTSPHSHTNSMNSKFKTTGNGRLNLSITEQQNQQSKECAPIGFNSKPYISSSQAVQSKANKKLSKDSQGFSEINLSKHLSMNLEFQEDMPLNKQQLKTSLQEKDIKSNNVSINQTKNIESKDNNLSSKQVHKSQNSKNNHSSNQSSTFNKQPKQIPLISPPTSPRYVPPISPRNSGPFSPRMGGPLSPRNDGPLSPRNGAPLSPRGVPPISPRDGGPLSPRNAQLSPRYGTQVSPRYGTQASPRQGTQLSPKNATGKYLNTEIKRISISPSISPNIKTVFNKSINKGNKSRDISEMRDESQNSIVNKSSKLQQQINEKSSTVKNSSLVNSSLQPFFKSIRMRNDKTPQNSKLNNDKQNTSMNKNNNSTFLFDKAKQFQQIGKNLQQKQNNSTSENQHSMQQNSQIILPNVEKDQLNSQKLNLEQNLAEEQQRWREFGSQMLLAYEDLNQNFQLLVHQKKQQDLMLQKLVDNLVIKESERRTQSISQYSNIDPNQQFNFGNEDLNNEIQILEIISQLQSKLYKKFEKNDSIQIQTLLNQLNKYDKQNKIQNQKQKEIEQIINTQIKESSQFTDQIIQFRSSLDKVYLTIMKNQKESNIQFSTTITTISQISQNKNNLSTLPHPSQPPIIQDENCQPNISQQQLKLSDQSQCLIKQNFAQPQIQTKQIDQVQNFSLGCILSPINSKNNINKPNYLTSSKQFSQPNNISNRVNTEDKENKINNTDNIMMNEKKPNNYIYSYLQFNNNGEISTMKQNEGLYNSKFINPQNPQKRFSNVQTECFDKMSPIKSNRVPFFGETMNNSDNNEEIQFQAQ